MPRKAIIIGAGPAGLTAAYELLKRTDIIPIVLEKSQDIGGISKTVNYKGNRIDIGGHRFFSKSDRVMEWWMNIMPIELLEEDQLTVTYQRHSKTIKSREPFPRFSEKEPADKVMLVRKRLSRIYFLRKFFAYPVQLSFDTLRKLGLPRTIGIMLSYIKARMFPRKPEKTLEDFFINRFGNKLYKLFFKDYTEKVWGMPCSKISAEWGAQRIKGISIAKALAHAVNSLKPKNQGKADIGQKGTETSLIEKFLYPKFGPGQLWEEVARQVQEMGGKLYLNQDVKEILSRDLKILSVTTIDSQTGETSIWDGDYFFSTMPVKELIAGMGAQVPQQIQTIAAGLQYRDFITVGVLLKNMPVKLPDTWIYIQERDVKVGRLQIFNNWSPYMVNDPNTVWLGMEYFCNATDEFWKLSDPDIQALAVGELERMGLAQINDVLDTVVLRVEKTYPAYFGTYDRFSEIRHYTDQLANLFLIGRNGMHKYNNSDHSMLTAMVAVDNVVDGITEKTNIWSINTEQEYHEEKSTATKIDENQISYQPKVNKALYVPFRDYLLKFHWNRTLLCLAAIVIVLQFIVFKHFYPLAGFVNGDSYTYLSAAYHNYDINTYPTGYSKFLRIFSTFTSSDLVLVLFQYLMLQCSCLYLIFTLFYFFTPGKTTQALLLGLIVLNPLFLYLSNYVISDALFIPLSITWFTTLIWMLKRPTPRLILIQVILLFFAFIVRYNALIYPVISAIAFIFSKQSVKSKLVGIFASLLLIAGFIEFTSEKYKDFVGIHEFTPFSGWQLANNAMYAYRHVDAKKVKPVPAQFKALDKMVRTYFDTSKDVQKHPMERSIISTAYMWDHRSPLQQFMKLQFAKDTSANSLKKWASMAPLYSAYGNWLIKSYPSEFIEYYLWPNMLKFYAPPIEFLEQYNMGRDTVAKIAQTWFEWKTQKVTTRFKTFKVSTLNYYPILIGSLNVIFLISICFYLVLKLNADNAIVKNIALLAGVLWVINFSFSVFASPVALRFQLFPIIVSFSVAVLLIELIWKAAFNIKSIPTPISDYININSVAQPA